MEVYFNPLDKACKSLPGAVGEGSVVTFHLYRNQGGEDHFSAEVCNMILRRDGEDPAFYRMKETDDGWTLSLRFRRSGLYFYFFKLGERFLDCGYFREGVWSDSPNGWQLTVFDGAYRTPEWFKGGILYQIFPDRFRKSGEIRASGKKLLRGDWGGTPSYAPTVGGKILNNDFFGGNLNGIREKLGYLKSLGVTAIYLNPIFEAASNHRYDTGDYMKIDPLLGTERDFDLLVKEAGELGIKIILDGVFNHTGDDSRYFNKYGTYPDVGAYQSPESPYADWYRFRRFPDLYDSWWGIEILPAVNEQSPSYQEFILGENGVVNHWLLHGIGGYRIDVADELPDFFLKKLRNTVKKTDPDALIIGEVWEDASNKIAYSERRQYLQGGELDSVMNYPLKDAVINFVQTQNTSLLRHVVFMLLDNYPKQTLDSLMNILSTHDTVRILTVFGGYTPADRNEMATAKLSPSQKNVARERVKIAALLQYTLPGVPCVYYGDEIAMEGYADPFCRRCFEWEREDDPLAAFYRKLGEIRTKRLSGAFKDGAYREIYADRGCLVFERKSETETATVWVNLSGERYNVSLNGAYEELLGETICKNILTIEPNSYGILAKIK